MITKSTLSDRKVAFRGSLRYSYRALDLLLSSQIDVDSHILGNIDPTCETEMTACQASSNHEEDRECRLFLQISDN